MAKRYLLGCRGITRTDLVAGYCPGHVRCWIISLRQRAGHTQSGIARNCGPCKLATIRSPIRLCFPVFLTGLIALHIMATIGILHTSGLVPTVSAKFASAWKGSLTSLTYQARQPRANFSTRVRNAVNAEEWVAKDNRRFLYASIQVANLDATKEYYQKLFGMSVQHGAPAGGAKSATYFGFGPRDKNTLVEATQAPGVSLGTGFGHFGLAARDVYALADKIKGDGGVITRPAGPVKGGKTVIAFAEDPDKFKWELIQRAESGPGPEPLCQVMLRVGDLDKSIAFYTEVLGMKLLRRRENTEYKYTLGFVGYGPEEENLAIELTYNWGVPSYDLGNAYRHIVIGTDDIVQTAAVVRAKGGVIVDEKLSGDSKSFTTQDPDGWKIVFLENKEYVAGNAK
eukprot:jgi/Mesvir1/20516/Mv12397-RA.1